MDIRLLKEGDYDNTLVKWWDKSDFPAPPKEVLPDNGLGGYMVYKGELDICAGFLYQTNSKIAWLEFVIANNEYRESDRGEALEMLINVMSIKAKDLGFSSIFTSLNHKVLISRYEKCGYKKASEGCTEMIKIL